MTCLLLTPLPSGIIDKEEFHIWKNNLVEQLKLNKNYDMFLPGGLYSEWQPLKDTRNGHRIPVLHPNDPDQLLLDSKHDISENGKQNGLAVKLTESQLLSKRNKELEEFIEKLAKLNNKANTKIIKNYGTNFEFIINFIFDSHNYEKKHENILALSEIHPSANEDFSAFYNKFRRSVCSNLKKMGTKIKFLGNFELLEDEILSPTFEEVILLWCLEKIDPRLPFLVNQTFGLKIVDNLTLKDIQDEIFEKIPQLLEETIEIQTNIIDNEIKTTTKLKEEIINPPKFNGEVELNVKEETIAELEENFGENLEDISNLISMDDSFDDDYKPPTIRLVRKARKIYKNDAKLERDENEIEMDDSVDEQRDCEFCQGSYKSKKILLEHVRGIHKVKYSCKQCELTLNNHKTYEKHIKENHSDVFPSSYEEGMKLSRHVCRHCHTHLETIKALRDHIIVHRDNGDITYLDGPSEPRKKRKSRAVNIDAIEDTKDGIFNEFDDLDNDSSYVPNDTKTFELLDTERPYRCSECGRGFTSEPRLATHMKDHRKGPIICEFCDRKLKNNRVLSEHIRIRHKLTFKCKTCNKNLKNQRIYEEHLKSFHPDEFVGQHGLKVRTLSHVCRYCLQPQSSHEQLKLHTFRHKEKGELNFVLKFTNDTVFNFDDNSADLDTITDDKIDLISKETKTFKDPKSIQKPKDKEMCDICGVYFANVEQHRRIHSVEGLTCTECDVTFEDRRAFLRHNKKHKSSEKKASCDQCGKGFTNIYHLNKHIKKHLKIQHIGGEKLKCETCNRTFFDKKEMGSHVCKHHQCDLCDVKFLRARNLRLHKRAHQGEVVYPCELCESLFLNKKRRREHFRDYHTNNEKKYRCEICDKRFLVKTGLTNHMYTHTGEKPFKCDECGLRFTQKGNLDTHAKLHSTEMPYECHVCHAKFKQSGEIKRHREVYKCGFSQDDFYTVQDQ